ncbi:hypothetical protein MRB53_031787 [Persea americana]|uniref:Uncharacterized protein n=1 Tax=Persea americana TaxID=3435 RepID=A0ACC2KQ24_PERAE|nr:hypothetical protein MRB53_031787 [Persea americana]
MALAKFMFICILLPTALEALSSPSTTSTTFNEDIQTTEILLKQACFNTIDPNSCVANIQTECERKGQTNPISIIHSAVKATMEEVQRTIELVSRFTLLSNNLREQIAVEDCKELLDYSMDELGGAMLEMEKIRSGSRSIHREGNLQAWLSAALSNQDTCMEGFEGTDGRVMNSIKGSLHQVTQLVSNVLAMYSSIHSTPMRPTENATASDKDIEFPPWVSTQDQDLVHATPSQMPVDAVVAADGTGRYRSIVEAVNESPDHSARRYVIYVKKGLYNENVQLKKKKMNIMLVGDGMGKTVVSGSRNFLQGWTTFRTATFGCVDTFVEFAVWNNISSGTDMDQDNQGLARRASLRFANSSTGSRGCRLQGSPSQVD